MVAYPPQGCNACEARGRLLRLVVRDGMAYALASSGEAICSRQACQLARWSGCRLSGCGRNDVRARAQAYEVVRSAAVVLAYLIALQPWRSAAHRLALCSAQFRLKRS